MEFDLISDVHIDEFDHFKFNDFEKKRTSSKLLVIAGDVAKSSGKNLNWEKLVAFITYTCIKYDLVIYIPGNHEYYSGEIQIETMATVFLKLKSLENVFSNLKVLDNEYYIMKEGVVVFGSTFWSDVPRLSFPSNLPIYILDEVTRTNIKITHAKWMEMHYKARTSLEEAIKVSKLYNYKLMVVTHYSPVLNESLNPKHHGNYKNTMYCTDLSYYFPSVDVWAFGHTGWNCDYMVGKTRIVSNQYVVSEGTPYEKKPIIL